MIDMVKRRKMTKKQSRKNFRRGMTVNPKNNKPIPMRGGFRM